MDKRRTKVAAEMRKACKATKPNINVQVQPWDRGSQGVLQPRPALGAVDELLTEDAPDGLLWIDLAERMNAPVYVLPPDGAPVVSGKQIYDFEASIRDFAERVARGEIEAEGEVMKPWLKGDAKKGASAAVAAAVSVLDGIKIDQVMEHHAMIDFTPVKKLSLWVTQYLDGDIDLPPQNELPAFVPYWAFELLRGRNEWPEGIVQVCEWVLSLKAGPKG